MTLNILNPDLSSMTTALCLSPYSPPPLRRLPAAASSRSPIFTAMEREAQLAGEQRRLPGRGRGAHAGVVRPGAPPPAPVEELAGEVEMGWFRVDDTRPGGGRHQRRLPALLLRHRFGRIWAFIILSTLTYDVKFSVQRFIKEQF